MRTPDKRSVLVALALSLAAPGWPGLAASPTPMGQELKPADVSRTVLPSVVALNIRRPDGKTVSAMAFLGVKEGMLVTALHVLTDAARVTAVFPNGEEFECSGVVDKDERRNVALIRIKSFGRPMLKVAPAELAVGAKVYCPVAKEGAFGVVEATVAEILVTGGVKFYRLSGEIPEGNNGCPIIDARGEVAGVHVMVAGTGKDIAMALPSAYVLALESSLPVQPWGPSTAQPQASGGPAATTPNDAIDAGLAAALIEIHNTWSHHSLLAADIYRITRFGALGLDMYKLVSSLDNSIAQLGWLKPTDPLREKLVQAAGQLFAKEKTALDYEANCAALNKHTSPNKETPQAEDAARRASGLLASIPDQIVALQPDFRRLAEASPVFLKALPPEMRYVLGLADRKSRLVLGAHIFANNPFFVVGIASGALGGKLDLRPGDTIASAGGQAFAAGGDIEDFKLVVEKNAGNTLDVVVRRGNAMKTLRVKVPADVLQRYPRAGGGFPWL